MRKSEGPRLVLAESKHALVQQLVAELAEVACQAIASRGFFTLILSGGSTPRALYEAMASSEWRGRFDWSKIRFYFGDERDVPPNDERSNFRMVQEALFSRVPVPESNVCRWGTEVNNLDIVSREYEAQLKALPARIDVALMGLGPDGHTASLFPHYPELEVTNRWCCATGVAPVEPFVERLTLTFPAFNSARHIWFLVSGSEKAEPVRAALMEDDKVQDYPTQGVVPVAGEVTWFLAEGAADKL